MNIICRFVSVTVLLLTFAPPAWAVNCDVTATSVNFGGYDPFERRATESTGSIRVTCSNKPKHPVEVAIELSTGRSGSYTPRSMIPVAGGSYRLRYNLYTNASMTTIFGNGTAGSVPLIKNVDRNNPWEVTIYGKVPARQNVRIGAYTDLVTVTILW
jgi:spore coat protein U-like protein